MQDIIPHSKPSLLTDSRLALRAAVLLVLGLATSPAEAQRPSFGGLFQQVQDMLAGDESFEAVAFGPNGECRIAVDPTGQLTGLTEYDPVGFRLMGDGDANGFRLIFGPTLDCTLEVQPRGLRGLILRDPWGIRILPPIQVPPVPPVLTFGETDDCRILVNPVAGGMIFQDPNFFRFENIRGIPAVQIPGGFVQFGELCTIGIEPNLRGIAVRDPGGLRLLGQGDQGWALTFGPTADCGILVDPLERPDFGLILTDPKRFSFLSPAGSGQAFVDVDGTLAAIEFSQRSSRNLKENIQPIDNALDKVKQLRGVRFDWKKDVRPSGASDLGFVAEEVAAVVSEAAVFDKDHKAVGVKFANLLALAVEGIKAQQEQLDAQRDQISRLQREIEALRDAR